MSVQASQGPAAARTNLPTPQRSGHDPVSPQAPGAGGQAVGRFLSRTRAMVAAPYARLMRRLSKARHRQSGCSSCVKSHSLGSREPGFETTQRALISKDIDACTVTLDLVLLNQSSEFTVDDRCKTVLSGDEHGHTAGELEARSAEGFEREARLLGHRPDGDDNLADVDARALAQGLAIGVAHACLEPIGTRAREHLVDADDMPGVHSDAQMEGLFTAGNLHVLVRGNASGFERLRSDLLLLTAHEMDASGESIPLGLLHSAVVHSELGVRHTTVEA